MSDDSYLVDKAVRLFTFLAKAQQLRQARVCDIDAYRRDGAVHWFGDLPDSPSVRWGVRTDENWDEHPILSVDRLIPAEPPPLPTDLAGWITGDPTSPHPRPELRDHRRPGSWDEEDLTDHPEITAAFEQWVPKWDAWAEVMLREQPVRDSYGELFKLYVQATQKSEELELILGTALLVWDPGTQERIRRHLFTVAVTPKLDEANGRLEFFLDESAPGLHAEFDMIDPSAIPDQSLVRTIEQRGHDFEGNPLNPEDVADLGRAVALQLHDQGRWDDGISRPDVHGHPVVAWAPALILRPRSRTGLVQAFLDIARQIEERGEVPTGLQPLIEPDRLPPVTQSVAPGALLAFDDEVVAPLPLNDVQRRILERVDRHAQTLVQGPPGTGKTHTAAALLTHLLAQGQRVLVTAHTDRALREVRTKLPDQIRPLAVSVIGASRDDLADLRTAVDHISRRATDHDEDFANQTVADLLQRSLDLDLLRRTVGQQLVDARARDVMDLTHGPYAGTLAAIAQRYEDESAHFAWAGDFARFAPESASPLTNEEAVEWLGLLRDASLEEDAAESGGRRLPSVDILQADAFAAHVRAEATARATVELFGDVNESEATAALRRMPSPQRAELQQRLRRILSVGADLGRVPLQWIDEAIDHVRGGADDVWRGRAAELREAIARVDGVLQQLPPGVRVELPGDQDRLRAMAESLTLHLQAGGSLRTTADGTVKIGLFTPQIVKDCRRLLEEARVNGLPPSSEAHLAAVMAHRDAWNLLDELDRVWPASVVIPEEDTPRERVEWHRAQLAHLDQVLELGRLMRSEDEALRGAGIVPPSWRDSASVERLARSVDAVAAAEALADAAEPLRRLEAQLAVVTHWADAAAAVTRLSEAVARRDHEAYAEALQRLRRLEAVSAAIARRDGFTEPVRGACPDLWHAVELSWADPEWDERLGRIEEAFRWGAVGAWVLAQEQLDANTVQAKISVVDQQLRDIAESVAAHRAWSHAVGTERLTPGRRADLRAYSQLVTRLGKGTGKYAAQQRSAIRRAMERCRPAVPVWIMPIYRVAEQFRMEENMFDVVVVDEASQAGLEATFLQYLAPKIVVIGDDKQVSPAAVGVDQQQLRDLANQYLHDDRYKDTWLDPQRSLFDEAAMRYGGQLTLVEHRRCVPEIIGFSNRIAYEPNGIRLIPVRQFGADRLAPFVVRHVADGMEEGASGKINRAEARALVDDVVACLADPAYDGLSMAVISLVGERQAKYIEGLLLVEVSAEEWARRDLRVGTAPDFQGSERNVVFLSMVSAAGAGRFAALTREMYVQRFNVAVSRAKDQVRLFHSVTLDQLPNSEDLRHQLLDYAYGVVRRGAELAPGESPVVPEDARVAPFDSLFEQRIHNRVVDRGFSVVPQVEALGYFIDLVVVGARARLAIECDGDEWHGPDAYERDLGRQRELERCGWRFFRVRESSFYVDPAAALAPLWEMLEEMEIRPSGWVAEGLDEVVASVGEVVVVEVGAGDVAAVEVAGVGVSEAELDGVDGLDEVDFGEFEDPAEPDDLLAATPVEEPVAGEVERAGLLTELVAPALGEDLKDYAQLFRESRTSPRRAAPSVNGASRLTLDPYEEFRGWVPPVVDATTDAEILDGLLAIVAVEGPVRGNRLRTAYVSASGGHRVGKNIGLRLNSLLIRGVRRGLLVSDNPLAERDIALRTYRLPDKPEFRLREPGPRALNEVPPAELAELMRLHGGHDPRTGREHVLRETLSAFGRTSLTQTARDQLEPVLQFLRSNDDSDAY